MTRILLIGDRLTNGTLSDPLAEALIRRFKASKQVHVVIAPSKEAETITFDGIWVTDPLERAGDWMNLFDRTLKEFNHPLLREGGWLAVPGYLQLASDVQRHFDSWLTDGPLPEVIGVSALSLLMDKPVVEAVPSYAVLTDCWEDFLRVCGLSELQVLGVPEVPGLVFPRLLAMIVNEAAFALMEGLAPPEAIDEAMRLGANYPEGPLAWADRVGVDVIEAVLIHLYDEYGEDRYRPAPLLRQMVLRGHWGRKTGQGFYAYQSQTAPVLS